MDLLQAIIVSMGAMIGSGMVARSIPYQEGFGAKQLAWMVHSGVVGAVIAPITLLGGPLIVRAACYTAGIVGGKPHVVLNSVYSHRMRSLNCLRAQGFLCGRLGVRFIAEF